MRPIWTRTALAVSLVALVLSATGITIASPRAGTARATKAVAAINSFVTKDKTICHDSPSGQNIPSCAIQSVVAVCPKGQLATGGGVHNDTGKLEELDGYSNAYGAIIYNQSQTDAIKVHALVYCAKVGRVRAATAGLPAYSPERSAAELHAVRTLARS